MPTYVEGLERVWQPPAGAVCAPWFCLITDACASDRKETGVAEEEGQARAAGNRARGCACW